MMMCVCCSSSNTYYLCSVVAVQKGSDSWKMVRPALMLMSVNSGAQVCAVTFASTLLAPTNVTVIQAT